MGLHRAGYEVTGVDINPQPEYPFTFVQADATTYPLDGFDFIWASPPCQAHSSATRDKSMHVDLIPVVRGRLLSVSVPWVIENVIGAPLRAPIMLCGTMFDLRVIRHRLFESNRIILAPPHRKHRGSLVDGDYVTVAGNGGVPAWTLKERERRGKPRHVPGEMKLETWQAAMGIDWMSRETLSQAIPPAYSEFLARCA